MENLQDTIVAISTGASSGAISIVRLSGKNSIDIADKIFCSNSGKKPSEFTPRMLMLGKIKTQTFCEQAMCVVFHAPNSFTGENIIEFQCHGGTQIASGVLRECLKCGARLATNGEFSKRAFLNGKLSLASAEGIMDMINAESDAEIRAGYELFSGNLSKLAVSVQSELTDILSEIEVSFDYPEETIEFITKTKVKQRLEKLSSEISSVLETAQTGKLIKSGINVVIVGKPNVGKSSLLNKLIGSDKAIVTDIAGTTRDIIEGTFLLDDIKVNLTDTAGIHETIDTVEKIGVEKAKNLVKSADIVLFLVDSSKPYTSDDEEIFASLKNVKHIVVKTKCDLKTKIDKNFENEVKASLVTGQGLDELKNKIRDLTLTSNFDSGAIIITNERHKSALERTLSAILRATQNIDSNPLDLISIDIKWV